VVFGLQAPLPGQERTQKFVRKRSRDDEDEREKDEDEDWDEAERFQVSAVFLTLTKDAETMTTHNVDEEVLHRSHDDGVIAEDVHLERTRMNGRG